MLLTLDVGNSDITAGLHDGKVWLATWRIPSQTDKPELFFGIRMRDNFLEAGRNVDDVRGIVLSSVVPPLTEKIRSVVISLFGTEPILLGPAVYPKLKISVNNPYEIGSDLVANAVAAHDRFPKGCIVVDFGTALTFTTLRESKIIGVAIAPGLKTAIRALSQNTAKLFDVPLEVPPSALGNNTVHAIQAGVLIGFEGLVRHTVQAIRKETGPLPIVATGGLATILTSLNDFFDVVDPQLTLEGLRLVGEQARA
jgi:type III pantothenate kinase